MSSSCSSNLRPLSWKEAGANWKSSSLAPTPSPRVRRPPDNASIVAACFASTPARRSSRQRYEGLVVGVDQSVEDTEAGEGSGVCSLGPLQDEWSVRPRNRCWQAYTDIHNPSLPLR